jgi:cytochrome c oxidase subunit 2
MTSNAGGLKSGLAFLILWVIPHAPLASIIDVRPDVSEMSVRIQKIHHIGLWICIVIAIIVFGAMFYSMFAHRRSKNATPVTFSDSALIEFIWALIPILIIVGMAIPATIKLL